jgi:phage terminase small subunit
MRASGMTLTEAYEKAGFEPDDGNCVRLAHEESVAKRIQELTEKAAERAGVTVDSLIAESEQARKGAMNAEQFAAAVAAIKEKGVLSGKRIERSERGQPGEFADLDNMSAGELAEFIRKQAQDEESVH